ncbi:MAG: 1-acyl-sn-glycerol-3-phosphate acyltransferase [Myxococcales bacterium]|nr:1-acyl-sn-glycerol-3-phosphate acyltransferase [Myxococcales bacterium]
MEAPASDAQAQADSTALAEAAGLEAPASERPPAVLEPDTPFSYLSSGVLWGLGLAWLVPMMGLQMVMHRLVGPPRMQWLERIYTRGQVAAALCRWRAEVHPDIAPDRPYLFFQNHVNHLDHCTMYPATPHFKQGVELDEHFSYPIYGAFMRSRGTIPVSRGSRKGLGLMMRRMREEVAAGHSLLVFPEGTRTLTGHLGELQPGVFRIAVQLGVPIVPVTVTGMYRVMRKGSYLIRPGHRVTVYCDAPIETAGLSRDDVPRLMEQVRDVMQGRLDAYWRENGAQS